MKNKKRCSCCGKIKYFEDFSPKEGGVSGLHSLCKQCRRDRRAQNSEKINKVRRDGYKNNPEKRRKSLLATKKYREMNKEKISIRTRENYKKMRKSVIEKYGGVCACCGENNYEFLAIDHVNGNGAEDRIKYYGSTGITRMLFMSEKIISGYRILCHNCNMALGFFGYCPHNSRPAVDERVYPR